MGDNLRWLISHIFTCRFISSINASGYTCPFNHLMKIKSLMTTVIFLHTLQCPLTLSTTKKYCSNQHLCKGTWRSIMSHYKPSYTHRIAVISPPVLSGLNLQDLWLGSEWSHVWNWDKTSWLLFLLLSFFIHPFFPSKRKAQSGLGLIHMFFYFILYISGTRCISYGASSQTNSTQCCYSW